MYIYTLVCVNIPKQKQTVRIIQYEVMESGFGVPVKLDFFSKIFKNLCIRTKVLEIQ